MVSPVFLEGVWRLTTEISFLTSKVGRSYPRPNGNEYGYRRGTGVETHPPLRVRASVKKYGLPYYQTKGKFLHIHICGIKVKVQLLTKYSSRLTGQPST